MIKKIENIIKKKNYGLAGELVQKELDMRFNFRSKKDRDRYLELYEYKRKLITLIVNNKNKTGRMGFGSESLVEAEYKTFEDRANALYEIAHTSNQDYKDILRILAFAIEERESIILLLGESGVGKSFLAEKIHQLSSRLAKPFIIIDCSPANENLSDSEIFGHIKGSFTGAYRDRDGALETAKDGIVFIDEIHRASQVLQNKLLNFLRTRKYKKLGSDKVLISNAKILIGTNQDPKKLVQRSEIKEDFFNRIANGRVFEIPPIRKRNEDIAAIIEWELNEYNKNNNRKFSVDSAAIEMIAKFNWPGNYDQLRSYLIRKLDDCFIEKVTILTRDALEKDPPDDKTFDNPFAQLEDALMKVIPLWNYEDGKFISDLIEPMLANIHINKMNGKRTKASKVIEISDKTLNKRLSQYKTIYEKYIKS